MEYQVGGRTAATTATANYVVAQLWNPHGTQRLHVFELAFAVTTAGVANMAIVRTTARGTAATTVTATIDNEMDRTIAPPSGALLDLSTFSAQPTIANAASTMYRWNTPAAIGAGVILAFPRDIAIPPGTGLAIVTPQAVIFPISDITFRWAE